MILKKIYISELGIVELTEGHELKAYLRQTTRSKNEFISVEKVKAWVAENCTKTINPFVTIVEVDELLNFINSEE